MTASWLWARAELRSRWRSWVVLGVLAGCVFGLAAAGVAGARRTSVAVPRYVTASQLPTAGVLANDPSFGAAQRRAVAELPEVRATYPFLVAVALQVTPSALGNGPLLPASAATVKPMVGVIVAGRMPNPERADEAVVDQNAEHQLHLRIGSTITVGQSISPADAAGAPPGMIPAGGHVNFRVHLRVVGIAKSVSPGVNWSPSSGLYTAYRSRLAGFVNLFVALRHGDADLPRFQQDVVRVVGHPIDIQSFTDLAGLRQIRNNMHTEEDGLLLFALAVIIGGWVLVGQALSRAVTAAGADLPTWRALGADRRIAVRALVLPAMVTAVAGVVSGFGVAVALSERFPIGLARDFDLDPGVHADWFVLGLAALAVLVAVLVTAWLSSLYALSRRRVDRPTASAAGAWAARAGLPPALVIGSRLAVEPGRGRRAVPVRSALIGAIVGVIGVVSCFTFRAGISDVITSPQRSGIVWNYEVGSGEGPVAAKDLTFMARDHDVADALAATWVRAVPINGVSTPTFGISTLKGHMALAVLHGRAPSGVNEIAFGPSTMEELKLHIGERVAVGSSHDRTVRVVGEALLPATSHTDYNQSGWMTAAGLHAALPSAKELSPDDVQEYVLVRWAAHTSVPSARHRLEALGGGSEAWFSSPVMFPESVVDLGRLRSLPLALGVFFALLGCATVAHALVTTVRRRRSELAVLRSLGFTRRQSRLAIAWQATLIAVAGVVVGVPLGIVAGRLTWRWFADSFPVVYVPPFALVAVVVVVPAAIVVANLLAAGPARSAARIRPAEALHAE